MPTIGAASRALAHGSVEVRVAEREDAAVGGREPVAVARFGVEAMPTIGRFNATPDIDPR